MGRIYLWLRAKRNGAGLARQESSCLVLVCFVGRMKMHCIWASGNKQVRHRLRYAIGNKSPIVNTKVFVFIH